MSKRKLFLDELETWLNTPFQHQGRLKGYGVDCVGLVVESLKVVDIFPVDRRDYKRMEQGEYLEQQIKALDMLPVSVDDIKEGDIVHYQRPTERSINRTQHVGVYVGDGYIIHADGEKPISKVCKAQLYFSSSVKIVGVYRLKELEI